MKVVDFSHYPAGRDDDDGPYNGAKFRDAVLIPALRQALKNGEKVVVFLDDVKSYGSSFLEEAFGGLLRVGKFKRVEVKRTLELNAVRPAYFTIKRQIEDIIEEAPTTDK
ncbi:DUF4325 domain-containing protein [Agrobacterium vitis]|nr:DUF4325 domain-containing protein [Allorhizobium ampelinum]